MAVEFELKYKATPELHRVLRELFPDDAKRIAMETTYYDTPDRFLSARRMTLRKRMENGTAVCTFKAPAGEAGQNEWECLCDDIQAAPEELCKLGGPEFLLLLTIAKLEPICGARFVRIAIPVQTADFTAELALDEGVLLGGGREEALCEVELELKSGDKAAMLYYAAGLEELYDLKPENRSKFRRALALAEGE